jgi:Mor family transcriptional regulator
MNAAGRRQRDAQIFMYRRRGLSLATLARAYGLTDRQCRRIIDKERAASCQL